MKYSVKWFVNCNITRGVTAQDLIEDVPGRTRKDPSVFSSPSDVKSVFKAVTRSSSKSYNIKDETSSKLETMHNTINLMIIWCICH